MAKTLPVTADLLSKHFWNALVFLALLASAAVASPHGAHGSPTAPAVPSTAPPVPTSIRNAPFSADVFTEYDHLLANGNHIHRETRGKVARDSQGRVRTETEIESPMRGGESTDNIAIQDPVEREVIHLDARTKIARVFHLSEEPAPSAVPGTGPAFGKQGTGSTALSRNVEPAGSNAFLARSDTSPKVESLGMKLIEGVRATGTRTTRTTVSPGGERVTAVTEVWFSPELQMVLVSISDDGEAGRSVTRLTNIRRTAPNGELFRVPAEYTVKDTKHIAIAIKH